MVAPTGGSKTMSTGRHDIYRDVHKGIRARLARLLDDASRTDFANDAALANLQGELDQAFGLLQSHADLEERFLAPLIKAAAPAVARGLDSEHADQVGRIAGLRAQLAAVDPGDERAPQQGHAFVVALSRFQGELLLHMADEEESAQPALWVALDDAELGHVHGAMVASIPPPEKARALAWMLPAMNAPDRAALLSNLRSSAPAAAFEPILDLALRVLSPDDRQRLLQDLEEAQAA
jgi:hypothetical protein